MRLLLVGDASEYASTITSAFDAEGIVLQHVAEPSGCLALALEHEHALIVISPSVPEKGVDELRQSLNNNDTRVPMMQLTAAVKPDELVANIREQLSALSGANNSAVVNHAAMQLNHDTRIVHSRGHSVTLTQREFMLLDTLASSPNQVFSKQQLLDQVWGMDFDGGVNVVEVYMGYLRRKLDQIGQKAQLETVHGQGYRLKS